MDILLSARVDFIKVRNRNSPAIYDATAKEVYAIGLPFDDHLLVTGSICSKAAGQRTLEHEQHMMLCAEADWKKIRTEPPDRAKDEETWCTTPDVQMKCFQSSSAPGEWLTAWQSGDMTGRQRDSFERTAVLQSAWP